MFRGIHRFLGDVGEQSGSVVWPGLDVETASLDEVGQGFSLAPVANGVKVIVPTQPELRD